MICYLMEESRRAEEGEEREGNTHPSIIIMTSSLSWQTFLTQILPKVYTPNTSALEIKFLATKLQKTHSNHSTLPCLQNPCLSHKQNTITYNSTQGLNSFHHQFKSLKPHLNQITLRLEAKFILW